MALKTNATFGITLEEAAFAQYERAVRAGCPLGVTSSYRDPNLGVRLWHENYTRDYAESAKWDRRKWGLVDYWRRKRKFINGEYTDQRTVSVAVPGTSRHEYGLALDLPGSTTDTRTPRGWMHRYGRPFGFFWPQWAQEVGTYEPWHIEFDRALVGIDTETDQEDELNAEQEKILREIRDAQTTMNARQIIMLNEQRAQGGVDASGIAKALSDALAGPIADAVADELASRGMAADAHTIAVAVTSRLSKKLA